MGLKNDQVEAVAPSPSDERWLQATANATSSAPKKSTISR